MQVRSIACWDRHPAESTRSPRRVTSERLSSSETPPVESISATSRRVELVPMSIAAVRTGGHARRSVHRCLGFLDGQMLRTHHGQMGLAPKSPRTDWDGHPLGAVCLSDRAVRRWYEVFCVLQHDHIAGWSSLVARRAHNPKVAGSNPAPATQESPPNGGFSCSLARPS